MKFNKKRLLAFVFVFVFSVFLSLNGLMFVKAEGEEKASVPQENTAMPKIAVVKYSVEPEIITAGEEFKVKLQIKNMSSKAAAENIKITYKNDALDLLPINNQNNVIIKKIKAKQTVDVEFSMKSRADIDLKPKLLQLDYEYEDSATHSQLTGKDEIILEVKQPFRVSFEMLEIPETVNAGDTISLTAQVINMGKGPIYNVSFMLEVPGLRQEGISYIGNMEPGTSKQGDAYVFVGMKEDISDSEEAYGSTNGTLTLTYEDSNGKKFTDKKEVNTTINPPMISSTQEENQQPETASQWWISVLILAGVIVFIVLAIIVFKKMKKLKETDEYEE